jgi:hypothetical protein
MPMAGHVKSAVVDADGGSQYEQYGKKGVRAALAGLLRLNSTGWNLTKT